MPYDGNSIRSYRWRDVLSRVDRIFNSKRITLQRRAKKTENKIKQNYRFFSSMCCYIMYEYDASNCRRLKCIQTTYTQQSFMNTHTRTHTYNIHTSHILWTPNWIDNCCEIAFKNVCEAQYKLDHNQIYICERFYGYICIRIWIKCWFTRSNNNKKVCYHLVSASVCVLNTSQQKLTHKRSTWR